jgi:hypothetical protein
VAAAHAAPPRHLTTVIGLSDALAGERASFITGATVAVVGGYTAV